MRNGDAVVEDERRPVARVSIPAIVASRIALFPQEGSNFLPSPAHRITPTRIRLTCDGVLSLREHHGPAHLPPGRMHNECLTRLMSYGSSEAAHAQRLTGL
jgi:hypothetical protein